MRKVKIFLALAAVLFSFSSCYKLQKDYNRTPHPIDPHINMTAWEYLNARANGDNPSDTIFRRMLQGIQYAELDRSYYEQPNKTYIFLHNDAIRRVASNKLQTDCFFGAHNANGVTSGLATNWEDYPKEFVRNYFLYLIVDEVADHYTLPPISGKYCKTLAPQGSLSDLPAEVTRVSTAPFEPNPESQMMLKVLNSSPSNTSDYPIMLNEVITVRTSSILATNGSIHVIDRFLTTTLP